MDAPAPAVLKAEPESVVVVEGAPEAPAVVSLDRVYCAPQWGTMAAKSALSNKMGQDQAAYIAKYAPPDSRPSLKQDGTVERWKRGASSHHPQAINRGFATRGKLSLRGLSVGCVCARVRVRRVRRVRCQPKGLLLMLLPVCMLVCFGLL